MNMEQPLGLIRIQREMNLPPNMSDQEWTLADTSHQLPVSVNVRFEETSLTQCYLTVSFADVTGVRMEPCSRTAPLPPSLTVARMTFRIMTANGRFIRQEVIQDTVFHTGKHRQTQFSIELGSANYDCQLIESQDAKGNLGRRKYLVVWFEMTIDPKQLLLHTNCNTGNNKSKTNETDDSTLPARLLSTGNYSDFTLIVEKSHHLAVHRCFLAEASPVFAAMFAHGTMRENEENHVIISDLSLRAAREMLRFIYTGHRVQFDQEELGLELLIASDKYQILALKEWCEHRLTELLSPATASRCLEVAHRYSAEVLKAGTQRYVASHLAEMNTRQDWLQLLAAGGTLVVDMFKSLSS